jgi:hypothetical protein
VTTLGLDRLPDRCAHGFHEQHHPSWCNCSEFGEWSIFVRAIKAAVRDDGTVHQGDVRPRIRGRIEPKHIGQLYRRARTLGLIEDTNEREPSTDAAGRNTDKTCRIYRLGARAAA